MSVIIGRALPDVRDGLKPAHRRVLYGMRDDGAGVEPRVSQVREDRRRGDGQLSPARRRLDLRHAGAPGAGLQHALSPGRRPGELRLDRRRSAGGDALHGSAAGAARRSDDDGSRQGDRRLRPQLRRDHRRADGPPDHVPEPAGERIVGHRRRHGHQHPAAQHARGDRRRARGDRRTAPRSSPAAATARAVPHPDQDDSPVRISPSGGFIVGRAGIVNAYRTAAARSRCAPRSRSRRARRATSSRSSSPRSPTR